MENADYKMCLVELISLIKDKSTYLKTIDANSDTFDLNQYKGMAMSYYFILDGIKEYILSHDELEIEEFGMDSYDPQEILTYEPLNMKQ